MLLVVILGILVTFSLTPPAGEGLWALPARELFLTGMAYIAGAWLGTLLISRIGLRRLMRPTPLAGRHERLPNILMSVMLGWLVAGQAALMLGGLGDRCTQLLDAMPLLPKVLAAMPFVVALLGYWTMIYPLAEASRLRNSQDQAMEGRPVLAGWTRRQFVIFRVRHHLLFVAVPAMAVGLTVDLTAWLRDVIRIDARVVAGLEAVALGGILLFVPAMIVRVWRTLPLEGGWLREHLARRCRGLKVRCRRILLWDTTGGGIANAGVIGIVPQMRYVLLSDALLAQMDAESVDAVFAHEAGHVVYRHILHMALLMSGLVLLSSSAATVVDLLTRESWIGRAVTLVAFGAIFVWVFGAVSRCFEWQADVFAAAVAVTDPDSPRPSGGPLPAEGVNRICNALLTLARLNGVSVRRWNFRHDSIQNRVDRLHGLLERGVSLERYNRGVTRVKAAIWLCFAAGVASAAACWLSGH